MSKKSRKRNKKILGALAAGLGAMALMRGKGTPAAANVDSGRAGDSSSALARVKANTPVTGTEYPGANKVAVADTSPTITGVQEGNTRLKRDGMGPMESVIAKRKIPGYGTAVAPPGILNPYRAPRQKLRTFKSGGRVKGAGQAKRGLGRAFSKGRK